MLIWGQWAWCGVCWANGGYGEDQQLPLLKSSENTAWHELNHKTMADFEQPTQVKSYAKIMQSESECISNLHWWDIQVKSYAKITLTKLLGCLCKLLATNVLIRDKFSTFECPTSANSGYPSQGYSNFLLLLLMKSSGFISTSSLNLIF